MVPDPQPAARTPARTDSAFEATEGALNGVRAAFLRTLDAPDDLAAAASSTFKDLVCLFVRAAKQRGEPPQRAISELRDLMGDAIDWGAPDAASQRLWGAAIGWCLDEYFGPHYGPTESSHGGTEAHLERERSLPRAPGRSD